MKQVLPYILSIFILQNAGSQNITAPLEKQSDRPNIIFIMTDDHTKQAMSAYGSVINKTPNLDRIAREGVLFTNSFVTNSICSPSRAVALTGKYSHINGVRDNRDSFDGSQVTFPKLLQKAGYQTAMIGKWHLKTAPTGFDYWAILPGQGSYYNPRFIEMGDTVQYTGYVTDLITDFAIKNLEERDRTKPFCLLYFHKAPHRNWLPNIPHLTMFDSVAIPVPSTFFDDYSTRSAAAREQDMRVVDLFEAFDLKMQPPDSATEDKGSGGLPEGRHFNSLKSWQKIIKSLTPEQKSAWDAAYEPKNRAFLEAGLRGKELALWKYQRYIKDYLRCVASVDDNVGRLLDYLDANGLSENTIIVYTSDQGFFLGEHGWYDKRFMYEESLGMPLAMRYPKEIPAGSENNDMVMNLDFAPTFLDYAGIEIPKEIQGKSFRGLLSGKGTESWRDQIYYHYYEYPHGWHRVKKHNGIRTHKYKLIHFYDDIDAWELYDLEKDPTELNNVYGEEKYETIIIELKERLVKLQEQYKDTQNE